MDKFLPSFLSNNAEPGETDPTNDDPAEGAVTRSRANNLSAPLTRHQRALQARRSPSPSPTSQGHFPFPPPSLDMSTTPTMANPSSHSIEDIIKIATASAQAAARELAATILTPATPDAAAASIAAASQTVKKVELPQFDKKNIHTWIRRVEAAFGRAGVTTAKDKFFFIEAKLDVNLNPKINEFLCGESTDDTWDQFLQYLQEEYGRSKEQQAALFLRGIPRDGLRPSQHLARIKDLTKDITLDDLMKEMVLKDLPTHVRQSLAERADLTADNAAKAADHYFDKEGNQKHKATAAVSNVQEELELTDHEEESDQINAVGKDKFRDRGKYRNRQRPAQRSFTPAFTPAFSQRTPTVNYNRNPPPKPAASQFICKWHRQFRERAYNCEPGCQFKPQQQTNTMAGNGPAGRRK